MSLESASRRDSLKAIFVVKSTEDRLRGNAVTVRNPARLQYWRASGTVGNARPEARVWTPAVVMRDPLQEDGSEVILVQRNHPVQTLAPHGANQPFAERIRLWRSHRRLENRQPHCGERAIDVLGIDAVAVV